MVNRIMVERMLSDIRSGIRDLTDATDITWAVFRTDKRARRFVERTLHIIIEACIDIAQHIISDEKFREPESYRDAFAVLAENNVLHAEDLAKFEKMAAFRNLLVHHYENVDEEIVFGIFKKDIEDANIFVERILDFLKADK